MACKVLRDFYCECGNQFETWARRNANDELKADCPKCGKSARDFIPPGGKGPSFRFNYIGE